MPTLSAALSYDFLQNAVLAGVLAAVLCGVIGTFVVIKRLAFISDGISHAAFGGMGVCFFLGVDPVLGAVPVALACAVALGAVDTETIRSYDSIIGVLWAVGLAVGIVFVYKTPGYAPNLMNYLFGNILMVSHRDVVTILGLAASVLLILLLFWKGLVAVAFDEVFARVQGL
ncbi:MAG TPA: metal ABC transporter permease, partial [Thermoanaerobaculia bacterium]|nr:metal ABC transporter permease [Thermoanaerobaculia bacterium]